MFNFYSVNVLLLAAATVGAGVVESRLASSRNRVKLLADDHFNKEGEGRTPAEERGITHFKMNYLMVYALVMGSDWLQGPYLFSLYHDEFGIDLHTIAILFVLGFLSAGISAPYVGQWADKYGRKKLCVLFTIAYALSCFTKMFKPLFSLASGRLLGGLATSILFSVFESWLVSSSKSRGMSGAELGELLGRCTLVNGIVAAASGLLSDVAVEVSGTFKGPFVLSAALLIAAGIMIRATWAENYGGQEGKSEGKPFSKAISMLANNPSLVVLCIAMTAYETSMYLFVFLWVPTMQDSVDDPKSLPLGTIFSAFMVAMMLGSIFYNGLLSRASDRINTPRIKTRDLPLPMTSVPSADEEVNQIDKEIHDLERRGSSSESNDDDDDDDLSVISPEEEAVNLSPTVAFHGKLGAAVLLVSSVALLASTMTSNVHARFYCFLLFEGTVGMYYPVLGTLRSAMLPEDCRATLSALFRVPLNFFVTLALIIGMESRRTLTFSLSALWMSAASIAVLMVIVNTAEEEQKDRSAEGW